LFHITCHSVWTTDLFRIDVDRLAYLRELAVAVGDNAWTCLGYCLMKNHLHLILEVGEGTLPAGMKRLNTRYACGFNQRHRLRGHVFGGRYTSSRILNDGHLVAVFAYVMLNPVEAGLCRSPTDWFWSSYNATIGLAEPCSFVDASRVLGYFGGTREQAIARLREYVEGSRDTSVTGSDPGLTPDSGLGATPSPLVPAPRSR
jgi:REP element-mobilizing transposase RayT